MASTEWVSLLAALAALIVALAGVIQKRRQPEMDAATVESTMVNSESVKLTIKQMSDASNIRRDLRILELEKWADKMRPWASRAKERDDLIWETIKEDRRRLKMDMPYLPPLPEPPEFPPPQPL